MYFSRSQDWYFRWYSWQEIHLNILSLSDLLFENLLWKWNVKKSAHFYQENGARTHTVQKKYTVFSHLSTAKFLSFMEKMSFFTCHCGTVAFLDDPWFLTLTLCVFFPLWVAQFETSSTLICTVDRGIFVNKAQQKNKPIFIFSLTLYEVHCAIQATSFDTYTVHIVHQYIQS